LKNKGRGERIIKGMGRENGRNGGGKMGGKESEGEGEWEWTQPSLR